MCISLRASRAVSSDRNVMVFTELRSGGKVGVDVLDVPNKPRVSVDVKQHFKQVFDTELCESRGGRPGLPSLIKLRFLWT